MPAQLKQPRMELDLITAPFEHDALEVVVLLWRTPLCGGY
ncbi:MAG: hypothetical protein LMBGKNDO_01780 [Bacteroidales bacterium]|nr:hypothetical protein [Bacteroidales bacterium]